jgi:hypothetical protein
MNRNFVSIFVCCFIIFGSMCRAQDASDPQPLIRDVIAAVGGPDKLLRNFRMKERFHTGTEPTPPAGKAASTRESILDAPNYWWIGKKERAGEPAKFDVWAWTLVALTDPQSNVTVLPEPNSSENEQPMVGLRISESIDPALDMYFDKQTKLLVRIDWRGDIYRFSDWREHDGVKYAAKTIMYKKATGKPWFYHEITELERLKEIPASLPR